MKKLGILLAFALIATFSFAQNNNGNGTGLTTINVASAKAEPGFGDLEVVEIKITRPASLQINSMLLDIPGSRVASVPMTKVTTEYQNAPGNSGNNANDTWVVSIDLDPYTDANGNVTVDLTPPCCYIPQGGIVVRSKGR